MYIHSQSYSSQTKLENNDPPMGWVKTVAIVKLQIVTKSWNHPFFGALNFDTISSNSAGTMATPAMKRSKG